MVSKAACPGQALMDGGTSTGCPPPWDFSFPSLSVTPDVSSWQGLGLWACSSV